MLRIGTKDTSRKASSIDWGDLFGVLFVGLIVAAPSTILDTFPPGEPRAALHHDLTVALLSAGVTFGRTLIGFFGVAAGAALFAAAAKLPQRGVFLAVSVCVAVVRLVQIRYPTLLLSSFIRASGTGF